MALIKECMLPDGEDDSIAVKLRKLVHMKRLTREYEALRSEIIGEMERAGYVAYNGDSSKDHIQIVGESYLYRVPLDRRGALRPFRGHLVRIACVGSGTRWNRSLMAGPIKTQ